MKPVTASSADMAFGCPASHALPQVHTTGEAAERGNHGHEFLRRICNRPEDREHALEQLPLDMREGYKGLDVSLIMDDLKVVGTEMAYVLNVKKRTFRFLGSNIGRNYGEWNPLEEIPVTIDLECVTSRGIPVETDWKTGVWLGDIDDKWQRRISAMVLSLKYDANTVRSRVGYVRPPDIYPEAYEFTYLELEQFFDDAVKGLDAVAKMVSLVKSGATPNVSPSTNNCQFCKAKDTCPDKVALIRQALLELPSFSLDGLTPEQKGLALLKIREIKKLASQKEEELKAFVQDGEILPADKGFEFRTVQFPQQYFDADAARGLMKKYDIPDSEVAKLYKTKDQRQVRRLKVVK